MWGKGAELRSVSVRPFVTCFKEAISGVRGLI